MGLFHSWGSRKNFALASGFMFQFSNSIHDHARNRKDIVAALV